MYLTTLFYGSPYPSYVLSTKKHLFFKLKQAFKEEGDNSWFERGATFGDSGYAYQSFLLTACLNPQTVDQEICNRPTHKYVIGLKGDLNDWTERFMIIIQSWMNLHWKFAKCHIKTIPAIHVVFEYLQKRTPIQICITPQKAW